MTNEHEDHWIVNSQNTQQFLGVSILKLIKGWYQKTEENLAFSEVLRKPFQCALEVK